MSKFEKAGRKIKECPRCNENIDGPSVTIHDIKFKMCGTDLELSDIRICIMCARKVFAEETIRYFFRERKKAEWMKRVGKKAHLRDKAQRGTLRDWELNKVEASIFTDQEIQEINEFMESPGTFYPNFDL